VVKRILFGQGAQPGQHLPEVIFVQFDDYNGKSITYGRVNNADLQVIGHHNPDWMDIPSNSPLIPIPASTHRWESSSGQPLSRTQFPLRLAWAVTIHKSQGLTLDKVYLDLGDKDFAQGLSFVGLSRVKTLSGLLLKEAFPIARLQKTKDTFTSSELRKDTERRGAMGFQLNTYEVDMTDYED
jgi:hypothetical protein